MSNYGSILMKNVLELVQANDGRIDTRIRLQKLAYIMQVLNVDDFEVPTFSYHHYGPYSRDLSEALRECVDAEFLVEQREDFGTAERFSYRLTEDGERWLVEYSEGEHPAEELTRYVHMMKTRHWRTLELAATVLYLEREMDEDREDAFTAALDLKPECASFRSSSERLLEELGL